MKTWQIYTLLGLLACVVTLQTIHVCSEINNPMIDKRVAENKQSTSKQTPPKPFKRTHTYDEYYWMELSKDEMKTAYAASRALEIERSIKDIDIMKASDMAREIYIPSDATYVGTLYEDDDSVYIIIKKTITIKGK